MSWKRKFYFWWKRMMLSGASWKALSRNPIQLIIRFDIKRTAGNSIHELRDDLSTSKAIKCFSSAWNLRSDTSPCFFIHPQKPFSQSRQLKIHKKGNWISEEKRIETRFFMKGFKEIKIPTLDGKAQALMFYLIETKHQRRDFLRDFNPFLHVCSFLSCDKNLAVRSLRWNLK